MKHSKFSERTRLAEFGDDEVKGAFAFCAAQHFMNKPGNTVFGGGLYARATTRGLNAEIIDAALRFLTEYGFLVADGQLRWVVRKAFAPEDVVEAYKISRSN